MKMLKSKNIRRICVLLAMLAPVVYLFGSLFSALTGAHGQEVFAEPVYVDEWQEVDTFVEGHEYKFVVDSSNSVQFVQYIYDHYLRDNTQFYQVSYSYFEYSYNYFVTYKHPSSSSFYFGVSNNNWLFVYDGVNISYSKNLDWVFYFSDERFISFIGEFPFYRLVSVPTDTVVESPSAYSDYVFKNFFAKDNFLVEIGKDVLSDNPHGFVPFASFWKYLDENMLHMGDMQLGLMGYGYVYYACHVLLFDIAFILVTFFLDFIQKVNDKVVGGVD